MGNNEKEIGMLHQASIDQTGDILAMRQRVHDLSNTVSSMTAIVERIEASNALSAARFERHMDREEDAFSKMYQRLKSMDNAISSAFKERDKEIYSAFKERDKEIHRIDKAQVKMLAYAGGVFGAVMIVVEYAVRWFG